MKMKLKSLLSRNDSIFETPERLLLGMSDFRYTPFSTLMSPLEVLLTKQGSCHDQVMFEYSELEEMGLNPQARFIMKVDEEGHGLETHSFIYYVVDDVWYWFESAWEDMRGIHAFDSYDIMIAEIADKFFARNYEGTVYIADFIPANHTIGESLETLVDTCMITAKPLI